MKLEDLQQYSNWEGESPVTILKAVKGVKGWAKVFPTKVPDWANSIRNYFNVNPTQLKFLGPYGWIIAPNIQKVGYWVIIQ